MQNKPEKEFYPFCCFCTFYRAQVFVSVIFKGTFLTNERGFATNCSICTPFLQKPVKLWIMLSVLNLPQMSGLNYFQFPLIILRCSSIDVFHCRSSQTIINIISITKGIINENQRGEARQVSIFPVLQLLPKSGGRGGCVLRGSDGTIA